MLKVFISGPYTNNPEENTQIQMGLAEKLLLCGFAPYVPLHWHFNELNHPKTYEILQRLFDVWLLSCDAIYRLPGESKGADWEVALAKENKIPVFYSLTELLGWKEKYKS